MTVRPRVRSRYVAPTLVLLPLLTAAGPATRPGLPGMIRCDDRTLAIMFDRPAGWVKDGLNDNADRRSFCPPGQSNTPRLTVGSTDLPGSIAKIDTTTPGDPKTTASRILTVDGQPARLTGWRLSTPHEAEEVLTVQVAKGSRQYTLQYTGLFAEHDRNVALLDAVCASARLD